MNAREVIAKAVKIKLGQCDQATVSYITTHLYLAGFTIMSKEDVEAVRDEVLEEAASRAERWATEADFTGDLIASAIRSLKSGGRGGKEARE